MKMPTLHKSEAGHFALEQSENSQAEYQENRCKDSRLICYEIYTILLQFTLD